MLRKCVCDETRTGLRLIICCSSAVLQVLEDLQASIIREREKEYKCRLDIEEREYRVCRVNIGPMSIMMKQHSINNNISFLLVYHTCCCSLVSPDLGDLTGEDLQNLIRKRDSTPASSRGMTIQMWVISSRGEWGITRSTNADLPKSTNTWQIM